MKRSASLGPVDRERRDAIVRLLVTHDDWLPLPTVRTGAPRGPVNNVRDNVETCPDCLTNGRVMFSCETCHGAGTIRSPRTKDPYVADDVVLPFGWDRSKHELAKERDRQIDALEQQLASPRSEADLLEDANRHPYGWETERKRMYAMFDYGPLDRALERLRAVDDRAYRLLHAVYIYGWLTELSPAVEGECERAIAFLSLRLPGGSIWKATVLEPDRDRPLRAPAPSVAAVNVEARGRHADRRALDQRDDAICAAINDGVPTLDVAARFNISASRVNRIYSQRAR